MLILIVKPKRPQLIKPDVTYTFFWIRISTLKLIIANLAESVPIDG